MSKKIGPRISISITPEQLASLTTESERTGATVAEIVRRALQLQFKVSSDPDGDRVIEHQRRLLLVAMKASS
jgi:hypothetical protein